MISQVQAHFILRTACPVRRRDPIFVQRRRQARSRQVAGLTVQASSAHPWRRQAAGRSAAQQLGSGEGGRAEVLASQGAGGPGRGRGRRGQAARVLGAPVQPDPVRTVARGRDEPLELPGDLGERSGIIGTFGSRSGRGERSGRADIGERTTT